MLELLLAAAIAPDVQPEDLIPLPTPVASVELAEPEPQGPVPLVLGPWAEHGEILTAAQEAEVEARRVAEAEQAAAEEAARAEREAREAREREEAEAPQEVDAEPEPAVRADAQSARNHWDRLADCESGNWQNGGASFEEGSARWHWAKPGTEVPPWGTSVHHGGLQFHPDTWTAYKPDGYPAFAYDAPREQQIAVAEKVQAAQGWGAWPVCSQKVGLR